MVSTSPLQILSNFDFIKIQKPLKSLVTRTKLHFKLNMIVKLNTILLNVKNNTFNQFRITYPFKSNKTFRLQTLVDTSDFFLILFSNHPIHISAHPPLTKETHGNTHFAPI